MGINLANNPFLLGQMQGYMEQSKETEKMSAEKASKAREQFVKQANDEIAQLKELMSASKTPEQRAAAQKIAEAMKESYAGGVADQFGVKDVLIRQIDMASQNPYNQKDMEPSSGGLGTFGNLLNTAGMSADEQAQLAAQRARTLARGGSDPFVTAEDKEAGKAAGKYDAELQQAAIEVPMVLEQLTLVDDAVDSALTGPIMGKYTPNLSTAAQMLDSQSTKDALQYVNQTKGAVSDREMAMFKGAAVGTDKTPEFNKTYLNIAKGILVRKSQQAEFFNMWKQYYGTTQGAYEAFKKYADDNKLFTIDGQKATLNKPIGVLMQDRSWEAYINQGGAQEQPLMPPIPPITEGMNGELTGGMVPPTTAAPATDYKSKYGLE